MLRLMLALKILGIGHNTAGKVVSLGQVRVLRARDSYHWKCRPPNARRDRRAGRFHLAVRALPDLRSSPCLPIEGADTPAGSRRGAGRSMTWTDLGSTYTT
jgi:hypothetical protein